VRPPSLRSSPTTRFPSGTSPQSDRRPCGMIDDHHFAQPDSAVGAFAQPWACATGAAPAWGAASSPAKQGRDRPKSARFDQSACKKLASLGPVESSDPRNEGRRNHEARVVLARLLLCLLVSSCG
jgi:hypothetical protein